MSIRKYHQESSPCPLANALDIVGDHWTLLVVRDLMFMGKHEYKDMLQSWEGISSNILTDRLAKLEREELVKHLPHPSSKKRKLYYLTKEGKKLFPILAEITRWNFNSRKRDQRKRIPSHLVDIAEGRIKTAQRKTLAALTQWEKQQGLIE